MKKLLISLNIFITVLLSAQSLTNTENYVYSRTYLEPVTSSQSTTRQIQEVQYFDGLGRTTQAISIKSTPTGKDLVLPVIYDQNGIVSKNFFPLPANTLNGSSHPGITENSINSHYGVSNAYLEIAYEKSPLRKVLKKSSGGNDWQISGTNTQSITHLANNASEVKKYKASATWDSSLKINTYTLELSSDSLTTDGYYNANTLFKFITKDEDGSLNETFVNSIGLQILVRKLNSTNQEYLDTYYVYDQLDNLVYIIPPAAAKAQSITQLNGLLNSLCYQYRYDKYNRVAESRLPGRYFWEYTVYDKQGRPALTQDSNQHLGAWSFVKYDKFDRPVYTGIYSSGTTRVQLQNLLDGASYGLSNESLSTTPFNADGKNIYYTKTAIPSTSITVLSVYYYDKYPEESPSNPVNILGANTLTDEAVSLSVNGYSSTRSTKGLPTASMIRNVEDGNWRSAYMWYDQKGQVIGTHSINHLGGSTKTEMQLDFAGFPVEDYTFHKRLESDTEKVIKQRYVYDEQKRLKTHYHQVNTNPEEILAQYEYDDLSRIIQKKVGGTSLSSPIQTIDYSYNIHGWLTGINKEQFSTPTNRLFAYDIRYNEPSTSASAPKYSGDISEVSWKSLSNNVHKRYNYNYDSVNRLTNATYSEPSATIPLNSYYDETLEYDLNGNITHLSRNAPSFYSNNAETIDDLTYYYEGNRLMSVTDDGGNPTGYEGGGNSNEYDNNGNLRSMPDRQINQISYNHLDLPSEIIFQDNKKNITYLYGADGTKLKKQLRAWGDNGEVYISSSEYIDGFQYSSSTGDELWAAYHEAGGQAYEPEAFLEYLNANNYQNELKFIPTGEGFYDFVNNKYIYQYKDHLGNARVSYLKNAIGEIEVIDQNDYYPFGMNHIRPDKPSYFGYGSFTNYKYNGKELQENGIYDYGWRQYMPDLGKWNGMDQMSEMYHDNSPYGYVLNNPIRFADPDGRCPQNPDGSYDCYTGIEEVIVGVKPKPQTSTIAPSEPSSGMPIFIGDSNLSAYFGSSGGGSSGGGGGGAGPAPDANAEYKKKLEAYRVERLRSIYYSTQGNALDDTQTVFGVLGNVPVAGEFFDGANGLISLGRGDKINAAANFSAMVPVFGTGLKYGIKNIPTGKFYSVAYEMSLKKTSYPGVTRYMHFKEANIALESAMKSNPLLSDLGIIVPKTASGGINGISPVNWVWHHDINAGVMQLVPKSQHPNIPGGIFWETMHPGRKGGYSIWGK